MSLLRFRFEKLADWTFDRISLLKFQCPLDRSRRIASPLEFSIARCRSSILLDCKRREGGRGKEKKKKKRKPIATNSTIIESRFRCVLFFKVDIIFRKIYFPLWQRRNGIYSNGFSIFISSPGIGRFTYRDTRIDQIIPLETCNNFVFVYTSPIPNRTLRQLM